MTTDAVAERMMQAALGALDLMSIYLGDRLGWYRALADGGPATPAELVARAGGSERYAREWLEQQAASGLMTMRDDGRFELPAAVAEVMTDTGSLAYLAPLAHMAAASAMQLPALVEAYRSGGGVSWSAFGKEMRDAQADMNRPWFERALPGALASVPEIDAVMRRRGARVADIGSGGGWSSIALARAYPEAAVDGFDVDAPSVEMARANASLAGVDDRVRFHQVDAADLGRTGYDAAFAFECVHDLPDPVGVLASMRRAVEPDGMVVIMDEAVPDDFAPPGDELERLMYGISLVICLPDGMSHQPSAATGTVMRPDLLRQYAREAGFRSMEILPIEDFGFWRFYRLML